jgi:hypothetical protein
MQKKCFTEYHQDIPRGSQTLINMSVWIIIKNCLLCLLGITVPCLKVVTCNLSKLAMIGIRERLTCKCHFVCVYGTLLLREMLALRSIIVRETLASLATQGTRYMTHWLEQFHSLYHQSKKTAQEVSTRIQQQITAYFRPDGDQN